MTLKEFLDQSKTKIPCGWMIAALSDKYSMKQWPLEEDDEEELILAQDKVLEIRIFNNNSENRLYRSTAGVKCRLIDDTKSEMNNCYDEIQFLDIDEQASSGKNIVATGGGKYFLPVPGASKVRIRYYLGQYDSTGQARIQDWRVVEFL